MKDINRVDAVFGSLPVLLPVVHPISHQEAIRAVHCAYGLGIKGVFLIDQGMHERELFKLVHDVRARFPSLWIGLNLLTRRPADALMTTLDACGSIDGIWSDNACIEEHGLVHPRAEEFVAARTTAKWTGLYFGGVAFKYQREVAAENLRRVAEASVPFMDVLCTSGPGTGYAADIDKVNALHAGRAPHAMALASGVTAENVRSYLPSVHAFLVGTGIESQLGVFDPAKIRALLEAMRSGP